MFTIFEELFLLALDEDKGNILSFAKKGLPYGLSGAILAELTLLGKVCSNDKHRLEVIDAAQTGDEVLDDALQGIQSSEKPRKLSYWVSQFYLRPKKLRERMGERMVEKELLYLEDNRFFWNTSSEKDSWPVSPTKFEIKSPLRAMILAADGKDPRKLALLSVASASDLLGLIFTQDELPAAKRRIHEQVVMAALENPAMETIQEIEQAVSSSLEDDDEG
jgi:hypothetical protein